MQLPSCRTLWVVTRAGGLYDSRVIGVRETFDLNAHFLALILRASRHASASYRAAKSRHGEDKRIELFVIPQFRKVKTNRGRILVSALFDYLGKPLKTSPGRLEAGRVIIGQQGLDR